MATVVLYLDAPQGSWFAKDAYDHLIGQYMTVEGKKSRISGVLVACLVMENGKSIRLTIRQEENA